MYEPGSNECCTVPASELTANAPGDLGDASPAAMDQFMTWRYRGATGFAEGAKFLRDEAIEFGGAKVDCYVVTVSQKKGENTYTWWVDKLHSRILREDSAKSSSVFTTIKLNEPLSDDLFKFEPPPGARKRSVSARQKNDYTPVCAPSFSRSPCWPLAWYGLPMPLLKRLA